HELGRGAGRRHDRPRRHLRPGMSAQAGDADVRDPPIAPEGPDGRALQVRVDDLAERVRARLPDVVVARGEVTVVVDRDGLLDALAYVRDEPDLSLDSLSGVTATDWPGRMPRYWLAYDLYSTAHRHRLRLKVGLSEGDPRAPSVT